MSYAPATELPPHSHESSSVTLVLSGGGHDIVDGIRYEFAPLTALIKPRACVHSSLVAASGFSAICFELPPAVLRRVESRTTLFARCRWVMDPRLTTRLLGLYVLLRSGEPVDLSRVTAWAEDIAAVGSATPDSSIARRCPRTCDAEAVIAERFRGPLRVGEIAEELGLHPVYLTRVSRRSTGASIGERIARRRVSWLAGRLAGTRRSVASLALGAGFADHAHACRVFRKQTGLSPTAYRALAGAAATSLSPT
ncbi:MAG: AraC family transcriptional regulator [Planctomycetota bacterium]